MKGKLFGIGVGPGDPKLLTLKAKELLDQSKVIAYPVKEKNEKSVALDIISPVVDLSNKKIVELWFKMDISNEIRDHYRKEAMEQITHELDMGNDVCMITLGDVSVYSTYMRLDKKIRDMGYETEVIPGIPSFCSGAARAKIPLMIGNENLAIIPSAEKNDSIDVALNDFDNIVIMKAYDSIPMLLDKMKMRDIDPSCGTVLSCIGMEEEYVGPMDPTRAYKYFTTVIIKKGPMN